MSEMQRLRDFPNEDNNNIKDSVLESESFLHYKSQEHSKHIKIKINETVEGAKRITKRVEFSSGLEMDNLKHKVEGCKERMYNMIENVVDWEKEKIDEHKHDIAFGTGTEHKHSKLFKKIEDVVDWEKQKVEKHKNKLHH